MNRDPSGELGGENLYGFIYNDPINKFDDRGLTPMSGWGFGNPRGRIFGNPPTGSVTSRDPAYRNEECTILDLDREGVPEPGLTLPLSLLEYYVRDRLRLRPVRNETVKINSSVIEAQIKGYPEYGTMMQNFETDVRDYILNKGRNWDCGSVTPFGSHSRNQFTVPLSDLKLRFSLQRFAVYGDLSCKIKKCCDCGTVGGRSTYAYNCRVDVYAWDTYDFFVPGFRWIGLPYTLEMEWGDVISGSMEMKE